MQRRQRSSLQEHLHPLPCLSHVISVNNVTILPLSPPHAPLSLPLSLPLRMCFYSEEHMPSSLHLPCCTGLSPGITTLHLEAATGRTNLLWKDATRRVHLEELLHGGLISSLLFWSHFSADEIDSQMWFHVPFIFNSWFFVLAVFDM